MYLRIYCLENEYYCLFFSETTDCKDIFKEVFLAGNARTCM